MARGRDQLGPDEYAVATLRSHPKVLAGPVLVLLLLAAVLGALAGLMPTALEPWGSWVLVALFVVFAIVFVLRPVLRWATTSYTITTRRIMLRSGALHRAGHDLPLNRITDVAYDRSLMDRIWGCGTIRLLTASDMPLELPDVPEVEDVHRVLADLVYANYPSS